MRLLLRLAGLRSGREGRGGGRVRGRRNRTHRGRCRGRRGARDGRVLIEDRRAAGGRGGLREPPGLLVQRADGAGGHIQLPAGDLGLRPLGEGERHLPGVAALAQRVPLQARRLHSPRGQAVHDELPENGGVLLPADAAGLGLTDRPRPLGQDGALEAAHVVDVHAGGGGDLLGAGARPHEGLQLPGPNGRSRSRRLDDLGQCGRTRTAHGGAQGVIDDDAVAFTPVVSHDDGVTVGAQQLELDHGGRPPRVRRIGSACHPRHSSRGRSPGVPWTVVGVCSP